MDSTTSIFQGTGFAMAAHSDRGLVRDVNEDAVLAVPEHRVMVVCDGLGGHAGGEVASGIAAEVVAEQFAEIPAPDRGSQRQMLRHVKDAIFLANHCILRRVWSEPELEGMGTTLCLAAFLDDRVIVANIGDSRCYLYDGNRLRQLTRDHNEAAELVDAGWYPPDSPCLKRHQSVLTRSLGSTPITVDVAVHRTVPGDCFLCCTDGLEKMMEDDEIAAVLARCCDPQIATFRLVEAANRRGGRDNVSVAITNIG